MAFTVAAVPTGIKAGVRITPRGIRISPVRAAPSVLLTLKVKVSVVIQKLSMSFPAEAQRRGRKSITAAEHQWIPFPVLRTAGDDRRINAETANSHRHRSRSDSLSRWH